MAKAKKTPKSSGRRKRQAADTSRRAAGESLSRTELVLRAFGRRARTIDSVLESLTNAGHEFTEKQIRSALDRARVRGLKVKQTARRTFVIG